MTLIGQTRQLSPATRKRPGCARISSRPEVRGRREDRVRAAPAVSCAKSCKKHAHEHTGSAETPGLPCAMVLRRIRAHPGDQDLFVTVAPRIDGKARRPVGPAWPPRDLTPTQRLSGPHDFTVRNSTVRQRAVRSLTELIPPCNHLRAQRCRVHHIPPRVSDDPDTPL
jgi:hypothetical protein